MFINLVQQVVDDAVMNAADSLGQRDAFGKLWAID